jgi:hypothetical protein
VENTKQLRQFEPRQKNAIAIFRWVQIIVVTVLHNKERTAGSYVYPLLLKWEHAITIMDGDIVGIGEHA